METIKLFVMVSIFFPARQVVYVLESFVMIIAGQFKRKVVLYFTLITDSSTV